MLQILGVGDIKYNAIIFNITKHIIKIIRGNMTGCDLPDSGT